MEYISKKLSFTVILAIFFISIGVYISVEAGQYHAQSIPGTTTGAETLACSQCHTMHGSQGMVGMVYLGGTSLYAKLLKRATSLELCLYCHDGDYLNLGAPDVSGALAAGQTLPSAGNFADRGVANDQNRHDIGRTGMKAVPPPGNTVGAVWDGVVDKYGGGTETFTCIYCHEQHGNRNYRNLRYDPGSSTNDTWASAAAGTAVVVSFRMAGSGLCSDAYSPAANLSCDVDNAGAGIAKFERTNVTFHRKTAAGGEPNALVDYNRISRFCGMCHKDYYGESVTASNMGGETLTPGVGYGDRNTSGTLYPWKRHPVGDVYIANSTSLHSNYAILTTTPIRYADNTYPLAAPNFNEQPICLSCHYAHGGGNPNNAGDATLDHSNLVMVDNANNVNLCAAVGTGCTAAYNIDTGMMRNTCNRCHNQ